MCRHRDLCTQQEGQSRSRLRVSKQEGSHRDSAAAWAFCKHALQQPECLRSRALCCRLSLLIKAKEGKGRVESTWACTWPRISKAFTVLGHELGAWLWQVILSFPSQKTRIAPSLHLLSSHPIKTAICMVRKASENPGHHPCKPIPTVC